MEPSKKPRKTLNVVLIKGPCTKDPVIGHYPSGSAYCNFNLLTNVVWKDKASGELKETVDILLFKATGKQAQSIGTRLKKGQEITIQGQLRSRSYEKNGEKKYIVYVEVKDHFFSNAPYAMDEHDDHDQPDPRTQGEPPRVPPAFQESDLPPDSDDDFPPHDRPF